MPQIDKRSGDIVVRIIYDGAPEAGKTTNIQSLRDHLSMQRRGKASSPGTKGRRTEFFDWLDFAGGIVNGKRVRCQLVSVPGQSSLLHRRRYILKAADAVVFVADSDPAHVEEARKSFRILTRSLIATTGNVQAKIIVQANKQDREQALNPDELRQALDAPESIPVLAAQSLLGMGVLQTFSLAVRLATERVQQLILAGDFDESPHVDSPQQLFEVLQRHENNEAKLAEQARLAEKTLAEKTLAEKTLAEKAQRIQSAIAAASASLETNSSVVDVKFPTASSVPPGLLWPSVEGRAILSAINEDKVEPRSVAEAWSPVGAHEFRSNNGWLLHTCDDWHFAERSQAKDALLAIIRQCVQNLEAAPPGRTVAACETDKGWRIWVVSPALDTLDTLFEQALAMNSSEQLALQLRDLEIAFSRVETEEGLIGVVGLGHLSLHQGSIINMQIPGTEVQEQHEQRSAASELVRLTERLAMAHPAASAHLRATVAKFTPSKPSPPPQ